jgi:hypothetical protein
LNKIDNYDINSIATVKCEFIKINNVSNYLTDIGKNYDYFYVDKDYFEVPYNVGSISTTVHSTTPWEIDNNYDTNKIINITPMTGEAGNTELTISFNNNMSYPEDIFDVTIITSGNVTDNIKIEIEQLPDMNNIIKLFGYVKYNNNAVIPNGKLLITNTTFTTVLVSVDLDKYTGEYSVLIPKGFPIGLQVKSDNLNIFENVYEYNEDTELNLKLNKQIL